MTNVEIGNKKLETGYVLRSKHDVGQDEVFSDCVVLSADEAAQVVRVVRPYLHVDSLGRACPNFESFEIQMSTLDRFYLVLDERGNPARFLTSVVRT